MREKPLTSTSVEKNRTDSPLLRLPGEICNQIYAHVFGNQHIEHFWDRTASNIVVHNSSSYAAWRDGPKTASFAKGPLWSALRSKVASGSWHLQRSLTRTKTGRTKMTWI